MRTRTHRVGIAGLLVLAGCAVGGGLLAQDRLSVGLSAVRAQSFANENLLFFSPEAGDQFAAAVATGDFNNDGVDDLATAIPFHNGLNQGYDATGIVVVRWGRLGKGLDDTRVADTVLWQTENNFPYAGDYNRLGTALAAGDFNGDGFDDLAVTARGYIAPERYGLVQVHYGHAGGIQANAGQAIEGGIDTDPEKFGLALAAGDFNGDGYDDLVVGSPNADIDDGFWGVNGGDIKVAYGWSTGLLTLHSLSQYLQGVPDDFESGDDFGFALAVGNFNNDIWCSPQFGCNALDDLAIGVPGEDGVGAVLVVFGHASWPFYGHPMLFWKEADLGGIPTPGARFGSALAAGDFDGDDNDDLAIASPYQNVVIAEGGLVEILYGTHAQVPFGFDLTRTRRFGQNNVWDVTYGPYFGYALAAADFDGDNRADLAVGHPGHNPSGVPQMGSITVIEGGSPSEGDADLLIPSRSGVPPYEQEYMWFGMVLASGDFDGNRHADLAIGIPLYDVIPGAGPNTGSEVVLYGALFANGFESGGAHYWCRETCVALPSGGGRAESQQSP